MRVPTLNGPSVESVSLPGYQRRNVRADTSIMEAALNLGGAVKDLSVGVERTVAAEEREQQKAAAEAAAVLEATKLLEFNEVASRQLLGDSSSEGRVDDAFTGTDTKRGFLASRGLKASELSATTLTALSQERQRIAETIADPSTRQRFMLRSGESMLGFRRQVENHVGREFDRAQSESAQALEDQLIAMATAGVVDTETFALHLNQAEHSISEVSSSPEVATARLAKLKANAGGAFVASLLAQGRTDEASAYVQANRESLGSRYVQAQTDVSRANAGAEQDRLVAEASKLVDSTYDSLRQEGAEYVTAEQFREAVKFDTLPAGARREAEHYFETRVRRESARLKADIDKERDNAHRADLDRRPLPGATEDFLRRYDPDFLLAREARRRAEARAWKAANGGGNKAAVAAAQKAVDQEFLFRLQTELVNNPSTQPADFLVSFIAEKARGGDDVSVSDVAVAKAGLVAAQSQTKAEKGELSSERDAARRFEATIKAAMPKQKGKPMDAELLNVRVGKALTLFRERTTAKGKPLDEAELAAIEAEVVRAATIETPRTILGVEFGTTSKKVMGVDLVEPGAAAPATQTQPKSVKSWAYSPDRKRRRPRFADGTLGPEEEVR